MPNSSLGRAGMPKARLSCWTATRAIRPATDPARMAAMEPVFRPAGEGRITAANTSQIADGAALVLVGPR